MVTITKEMIDIITILRRRINNEFEVPIKLANQDLMSDLVGFYHKSTDQLTKELIHEVLTLAGENWVGKLKSAPKASVTHIELGNAINSSNDTQADNAQPSDTQELQGADVLINGIKRIFDNTPESSSAPNAEVPAAPAKRVRRYRGQIIHD